jgi:hypothetical protein
MPNAVLRAACVSAVPVTSDLTTPAARRVSFYTFLCCWPTSLYNRLLDQVVMEQWEDEISGQGKSYKGEKEVKLGKRKKRSLVKERARGHRGRGVILIEVCVLYCSCSRRPLQCY